MGFSFARQVVVGAGLAGLQACAIELPDASGAEPAASASAPGARASEPGGLSSPHLRVDPQAEPEFDRVVLVTIDTLRADHVGCYGYARDTTPFLDELAAGGVRFTRAMASMPHTAPSHATMLTGMHPQRHGLRRNGEQLLESIPTLAGAFAEAGFETAAFLSVKFLAAAARDFEVVVARNHDAGSVTDAALEWLRAPERGKRLFAWLHYYDPHRWMTADVPPAEDLEAVRSSASELQGASLFEYLLELHALDVAAEGEPFEIRFSRAGRVSVPHAERDGYLRFIDAYDAQIRWVDRELRRFDRALAESRPEARTLWVVTADHGEGLGSHGVLGHGASVHNEQLRVPLILHASDGSVRGVTGDRVEELVQLVDLMPTLAATFGARLEGYDPALDGASLWPLLTSTVEDSSDWRPRPAFSTREPQQTSGTQPRADELFALQSERFKWITDVTGAGQFYDLALDPLELDERSREYAAERAALEALLAEHLARLPLDTVRGEQELPPEWLEELRALGYVE